MRLAHKILTALEVDLDRSAQLLKQCTLRAKEPEATSAPQRAFHQMTMDQFHLISDWHYFAILSLAETRDFPGSQGKPAWIASRLGISPQQARTAVERLERLGLLERGPDGLRATGQQLTTTTDISSLGIRRAHHQALEQARESLETDPVDSRDFSHITMAVDPARIPEAKRRISEFRSALCGFLEGGEKKEVFKMSIQLFPLTKGKKK